LARPLQEDRRERERNGGGGERERDTVPKTVGEAVPQGGWR